MKDIKFYPVKRVIEEGIEYNLPKRKTKGSAAYDLEAIEDTIIPSKPNLLSAINFKYMEDNKIDFTNFSQLFLSSTSPILVEENSIELSNLAKLTKGFRPTIVRTGMKIQIPDDMVCLIVPRSSTPLKYWLKVSNSPGVIDADYFSNEDNDGEIGIIVENELDIPIKIKKGEVIGQALIIPKETVNDEEFITETRKGGYGSTTK